MIHYIDKPGFYRTFSGTPPTFLTPEDLKREEGKHLIRKIAAVPSQRGTLFALLANHGAENLKQVPEHALPLFLAELRAVALALGLK